MRNYLLALTPLLAVGCAGHWVHPEHSQQQIDQALYECMRENSFYGEDASFDRAGARSSKGIKVDPQLTNACMRAQGYELERKRDAREGQARTQRTPPTLAVETGASYSAGFYRDYYRGLQVEQGQIVDSRNEDRILGTGQTGVEVALPIRASELLTVAPRLGARSGYNRVTRSAFLGRGEVPESNTSYGDDPIDYSSGGGPVFEGGADLRLALPVYPNLHILGGAALQALPGGFVDRRSGSYEEVDDNGVATTYDYELDSIDIGTALLPVARLGVGWNPVWAEPHGLRTGCAVELPLTNTSFENANYSANIGASCSVAWAFKVK